MGCGGGVSSGPEILSGRPGEGHTGRNEGSSPGLLARIQGSFSARPRGENLAFLVFLGCCLQAALLFPRFTLVPGERTNLFTAFLAGVSFLACMLFVRKTNAETTAASRVTAVLSLLVLLSGWLSVSRAPAMFRGIGFILTGAGGFWCARLLLRDQARRQLFVLFCMVLLLLVIAGALAGGFIDGTITRLLDDNPHQVVCKIFLLAFAPVTLLRSRARGLATAGALGLLAAVIVLLLSKLRSAVIIPVVIMFAVVATTGRFRTLKAAAVGLFGCLLFVLVFWGYPDRQLHLMNYLPVSYRVESYPFSWHIAKQHPFLGNGLRASRQEYLDGYTLKSSLGHRRAFARNLRRVTSSENVFLTFMADLGFPFLVLYLLSVGAVFTGAIRRAGGAGAVRKHRLLYALTLSLSGVVLHCLTTDDLLVPHVNWFFHVLLGMVSVAAGQESADPGDDSVGSV